MTSKADLYRAEAQKLLAKKDAFSITSVFGLGGGKSDKLEEASELFVKSANAYKLANQWQSAGDALTAAGDCLAEGSKETSSDAAGKYAEAGLCYKKINPELAVKALQSAVELYNDLGRFGASARNMKEMAEIFEADNNIEMAISSYEQASNLFTNDNKKSNASQCLVKIANMSSTSNSSTKDLLRAAQIFEDIGTENMTSNLGKYAAKGNFFQCILCHMAANDMVSVSNKLEACKNADFSFASSRECQFIEKLVGAVESQDAEEYATVCSDFDRITPLDPWKVSMLSRAKHMIVAEEGEGEDGEVDLS